MKLIQGGLIKTITSGDIPNGQVLIDGGMDPVEAAYKTVDEQTVVTTKELTGRIVTYGLMIAAAVLGIIAAILGLTGKKAAMTVGIISLIAALAALVYGYAATVSFTGHTVQAAGAIVLAVAAVLMVYGAAAAKKAPVTAQ